MTAMNFYGSEASRVMRTPDAWVGKHVRGLIWQIPDGYDFCAITGKLHRERDMLISCYVRHVFDRDFLIAEGIYVEEADWLSEEGYDLIVAKLERLGLYQIYRDGIEGL